MTMKIKSGDALAQMTNGVLETDGTPAQTPVLSGEITTLEDMEALICTVIGNITGLPVVNERNPGPQYPKAYATYRTLAWEGLVHPYRTYCCDSYGYTERILDSARVRSWVKVVGMNAVSRLKRFCMQLSSAQRYADLFSSVVVCGVEAVQNISTYFASRVQEQAVVHIDWNVAVAEINYVDYFTKVPIEVVVKDLAMDNKLVMP
jgi:hypothetical protein